MMMARGMASGCRTSPGAGSTRRSDGTVRTLGRSRGADQCSQVHQRLVELPCRAAAFRLQRGRKTVELSGRCGPGAEAGSKHPPDHASHVGVHGGSRPLVGKGGDSAGSVRAHAGQSPKLTGIPRQAALMVGDDGASEGVEIVGAPIVTQALPAFPHRLGTSLRQGLHRGIALEEFPVVLLDAGHLGLLQHELGHENLVRVSCATPREVTPLAPEPRKQATFERERVGGMSGGHGQGTYVGGGQLEVGRVRGGP